MYVKVLEKEIFKPSFSVEVFKRQVSDLLLRCVPARVPEQGHSGSGCDNDDGVCNSYKTKLIKIEEDT